MTGILSERSESKDLRAHARSGAVRPAEDDLATTRAKAKRPAEAKPADPKSGPRKKKTGLA